EDPGHTAQPGFVPFASPVDHSPLLNRLDVGTVATTPVVPAELSVHDDQGERCSLGCLDVTDGRYLSRGNFHLLLSIRKSAVSPQILDVPSHKSLGLKRHEGALWDCGDRFVGGGLQSRELLEPVVRNRQGQTFGIWARKR